MKQEYLINGKWTDDPLSEFPAIKEALKLSTPGSIDYVNTMKVVTDIISRLPVRFLI